MSAAAQPARATASPSWCTRPCDATSTRRFRHNLHRHELWDAEGQLVTTFMRRHRLRWWTARADGGDAPSRAAPRRASPRNRRRVHRRRDRALTRSVGRSAAHATSTTAAARRAGSSGSRSPRSRAARRTRRCVPCVLSRYGGNPIGVATCEHRLHRRRRPDLRLAGAGRCRVPAGRNAVPGRWARIVSSAARKRSLASPSRSSIGAIASAAARSSSNGPGGTQNAAHASVASVYDSPRGTLEYRLSSSNTCSRIDRARGRIGQRPHLQRVVEERPCHRARTTGQSSTVILRMPCSGSRESRTLQVWRRDRRHPRRARRRAALRRAHRRVGQHRRPPPGRPNLPSDGCPFCVGGLEAPDPYDVRWFPNRWPALAPGRADRSRAIDGSRRHERTRRGRRVRGRAVLARARRVARDAPARAGAQGRRPLGRAHRRAARPAGDRVRARCSRTGAARSARPSTTRTARSTATRSSRRRPRARLQRAPTAARSAARSSRNCDARSASSPRHGDWVALGAVRVGYAYGTADRAPARTSARCPRSTTRRATTSRASSIDVLGRYDRLWPAPRRRLPLPVPAVVPPGAGERRRRVARARARRAAAARAGRAPLRRVGRARQRHVVESGRARRRGASAARCLNPRAVSARRVAST